MYNTISLSGLGWVSIDSTTTAGLQRSPIDFSRCPTKRLHRVFLPKRAQRKKRSALWMLPPLITVPWFYWPQRILETAFHVGAKELLTGGNIKHNLCKCGKDADYLWLDSVTWMWICQSIFKSSSYVLKWLQLIKVIALYAIKSA